MLVPVRTAAVAVVAVRVGVVGVRVPVLGLAVVPTRHPLYRARPAPGRQAAAPPPAWRLDAYAARGPAPGLRAHPVPPRPAALVPGSKRLPEREGTRQRRRR